MFELLLSSNKPHAEIKNLLDANLLSTKDGVPEFYDVLAKIYWYRIYTINIDNVLPLIYDRVGLPKLRTVSFPNDDPKERDQFLESVQAVYLHGKLPCRPTDLIFSRHQYAKSSVVHLPLYSQFIQDYTTLCTVFVGTFFDEELAWQYIEQRKMRPGRTTEGRPLSFLIDPNITEPQRRLLSKYNIRPVTATVQEFLSWLDSHLQAFPDKESILLAKLPILSDLSQLYQYHRFPKSIKSFASSFQRVPVGAPVSQRSFYLLGANPTWNDIRSELDSPRTITASLKEDITSHFTGGSHLSVFVLLGYAGAGKSTIMRRLGVELTSAGRDVFFTDADQLPRPASIAEALIAFDSPVVLLFDNAEAVLRELSNIVIELQNLDKPIALVIAARTNEFDRLSGRLDNSIALEEYLIPDLDRKEILNIIGILEQNGKLGKLRGMSSSERIKEFEHRAKKQILVAMREATSGQGFDKIIEDEFTRIEPLEAQMLCLCTALATSSGYRLTKGEFVACSRSTPAEALHYLTRNLNGIVIGSGTDDALLSIRHRKIAEHYIRSRNNITMIKDAYIRLLSVLAPKINQSHWRSRVFQLYRDLINHSTVYARFYERMDEARNIYDYLIPVFENNHHFWLQYGSLELEAGRLDLAENYLHQSYSLEPTDYYVVNALGHLELRKALFSDTLTESMAHREEGERILREQILEVGSKNPYCYHILCLQMYNWIKEWVTKDETKKRELDALRKVIKEGISEHPNNKRLAKLKDVIERAYLNLAIPIDERPQDPSYAHEWYRPLTVSE